MSNKYTLGTLRYVIYCGKTYMDDNGFYSRKRENIFGTQLNTYNLEHYRVKKYKTLTGAIKQAQSMANDELCCSTVYLVRYKGILDEYYKKEKWEIIEEVYTSD